MMDGIQAVMRENKGNVLKWNNNTGLIFVRPVLFLYSRVKMFVMLIYSICNHLTLIEKEGA